MAESAIAHTDGASRGNPGPSAIAFTLAVPGEDTIEYAEVIPDTTNNVAEYTALVAALTAARKAGVQSLQVLSDSELMVKQMNGEYRVKNPDLQDLFAKAKELERGVGRVTYQHIRREQNKKTDQLCNQVLDKDKPKAAAKEKASATKGPATAVSDDAVREEALVCLMAAAQSWATHGANIPAPGMVWDQLWSILEENGVLKKVKGK